MEPIVDLVDRQTAEMHANPQAGPAQDVSRWWEKQDSWERADAEAWAAETDAEVQAEAEAWAAEKDAEMHRAWAAERLATLDREDAEAWAAEIDATADWSAEGDWWDETESDGPVWWKD